MKRYIYTALFTFCLLAANMQNGYAQNTQKIDPTVEVQRDFDSKMPNIHKSRLNSAVNDTLSNFNLNFNYSIFDKPYRDLYEFSPLPSAQIQSKVEQKYPVFLAKLGIGVPTNPMADIWFQPYLTGGNTLQFNASFNGFYDNIEPVTYNGSKIEKADGKEAAANNHSFKLGGTYGYHWNSGELSLGLKYSTNYNTYYGFNLPYMELDNPAALNEEFFSSIKDASYMKDNYSHNYNQVGADFSIASIDAASKGAKFNYRLDLSYLNTSDKLPENGKISTGLQHNKLNESYIKASGEIGPTFGRYNKITLAVNSETAIYKNLQDYNYGIIEVIPQYAFENGKFTLKAGVKISGQYTSKDDADKYHTPIFAKANIAYELAKDNLWIYADLDGGNYLNNYSSLLNENRWIAQDADLKAGSIPFMLKAGFRGQAHNKFSYNVYAKYAVHKGLLQYIMSPDSRLYTAYSNHNEFSVGAALNWYSEAFDAGTTLEYSNYTDGKESTLQNGCKPYGYAPFKWFIHGTYNYRERIYIGFSADVRGAAPMSNSSITSGSGGGSDSGIGSGPGSNPDSERMSGREFEAKGFCNLAAHAKYVINPVFSVFITGENLLNAQVLYHPQYLEKGISFSAGVLVKL